MDYDKKDSLKSRDSEVSSSQQHQALGELLPLALLDTLRDDIHSQGPPVVLDMETKEM